MECLLHGLPGHCRGILVKDAPISSLNLQKGVIIVHIVGGGIKVPPFLLIQRFLGLFTVFMVISFLYVFDVHVASEFMVFLLMLTMLSL
ncbi:hypothetical protein [Methanothermobacter sp.]|uniref:hypothetical protein n=1 Tax=Methanothermobacter sp. TaxID=1884223 RepID=UPI0026275A3F|nr:hypothetical protein [Methanothermobacter sp.]MDI9614743.1 hypothetical protein [Methanothermobacter sp.]